jgi:serine/threonine-protein kinase PRP4
VLGLPYNEMADMWSVGCVVYEMYTGKVLFAAEDNNPMLALMQETLGPLPPKMVKAGRFRSKHFDDTGAFLAERRDPATGHVVVEKRRYQAPTAGMTLLDRLRACSTDKDRHLVPQLADLLERMLCLSPQRRISATDALAHPFLRSPSEAAAKPKAV